MLFENFTLVCVSLKDRELKFAAAQKYCEKSTPCFGIGFPFISRYSTNNRSNNILARLLLLYRTYQKHARYRIRPIHNLLGCETSVSIFNFRRFLFIYSDIFNIFVLIIFFDITFIFHFISENTLGSRFQK